MLLPSCQTVLFRCYRRTRSGAHSETSKYIKILVGGYSRAILLTQEESIRGKQSKKSELVPSQATLALLNGSGLLGLSR